jgi:hypothetical protein
MFRCPECRTRRKDYGLFTRHLRDSGHAVCKCGGYHFWHRKYSPYCQHNPQSGALVAWRDGASADEVLEISIDLAWEKPGRKLVVWPPNN